MHQSRRRFIPVNAGQRAVGADVLPIGGGLENTLGGVFEYFPILAETLDGSLAIGDASLFDESTTLCYGQWKRSKYIRRNSVLKCFLLVGSYAAREAGAFQK